MGVDVLEVDSMGVNVLGEDVMALILLTDIIFGT